MKEGGEPLAPSRRVLLALAGFAAILFLLAAGLAAAGVGTEIWSAVPTSQHSMPTTEGTARFNPCSCGSAVPMVLDYGGIQR